MIPAAIKQKLILAAISAVRQTADARKHFRFWPSYLKLDPTWGLKLTQDLLDEISDLLPSNRNLRILYDERLEQNAKAYHNANQGKQNKPQPTSPKQTPADKAPKPQQPPQPSNKPDIDLDDDADDDFLDNLNDLLSHEDDDADLVIPTQNRQPTTPPPAPVPAPAPSQQQNNQPTTPNSNNDNYILNKASLYANGSTVYWPSKRWGKLALVSGTVIGKKPGTVSDFLVIERPDGRIVNIDPEITQVSKKKPTWTQRISTSIMGESIDKFLKS